MACALCSAMNQSRAGLGVVRLVRGERQLAHMKRITVMGLTLIAAMAIGSMVASAASAETIWLAAGALLAAAAASNTEGELELKESTGTNFLCSGHFVGSVGPDAEDEITAVEDLVKTVGGLDCVVTAHGPCEEANGALQLVVPLNLPWKTKLELVGTETRDVLSNATNSLGYLVECKVFGFTVDVKCTGSVYSVESNGATDVIGKFSAVGTEVGCSDGGKGTLVGEGLTSLASGSALQVSEG
jgi:hypothetical protein